MKSEKIASVFKRSEIELNGLRHFDWGLSNINKSIESVRR